MKISNYGLLDKYPRPRKTAGDNVSTVPTNSYFRSKKNKWVKKLGNAEAQKQEKQGAGKGSNSRISISLFLILNMPK